MITRLGVIGIPRPVYGSFAGKTATALVALYSNVVAAVTQSETVEARTSQDEVTK